MHGGKDSTKPSATPTTEDSAAGGLIASPVRASSAGADSSRDHGAVSQVSDKTEANMAAGSGDPDTSTELADAPPAALPQVPGPHKPLSSARDEVPPTQQRGHHEPEPEPEPEPKPDVKPAAEAEQKPKPGPEPESEPEPEPEHGRSHGHAPPNRLPLMLRAQLKAQLETTLYQQHQHQRHLEAIRQQDGPPETPAPPVRVPATPSLAGTASFSSSPSPSADGGGVSTDVSGGVLPSMEDVDSSGRTTKVGATPRDPVPVESDARVGVGVDELTNNTKGVKGEAAAVRGRGESAQAHTQNVPTSVPTSVRATSSTSSSGSNGSPKRIVTLRRERDRGNRRGRALLGVGPYYGVTAPTLPSHVIDDFRFHFLHMWCELLLP